MTAETIMRAIIGMTGSITAFREGRLSLDLLSSQLKKWIAEFDGVADDASVDELRALRNQVEYINAFWIESGRQRLTEDERHAVDEATTALEAMLRRY